MTASPTPGSLHAAAGSLPAAVKIVEVGPRDGLQNEAQFAVSYTHLTLPTNGW